MRIGLNLLYLIPGQVGGTETYAAGLIEGLARIDDEDRFLVFVNREAARWALPETANIERVVCGVRGASRPRRYIYEQVRLPFLLKRKRVDLVHSLGYVGPVLSPCPSVVTIHDLNYVDLAETIPGRRRIPLSLISALAARKADRVITISDFSKGRISRALKLPPDDIVVTYLAAKPPMPSHEGDAWAALKGLYNIREPYIAAISGRAVHKNIVTLIQGFETIRSRVRHNLVLIGHLPPDIDRAKIDDRQDPGNRIVAVGYVPETHLYSLLRHADLFVLPSLYEGFGLPVLEAQQAGIPVVCSREGSLPEIAGEAAVYFDPKSPLELAQAMVNVIQSPMLRSELVSKGNINIRRFTWERTARETIGVYRNALEKHPEFIDKSRGER